MLVDDDLLRHALCAGGTDIVGIEHFQHIGTGVAHETAYADYGNGNRGQDKMLGHIQEFSEVREILIISSLHTRKLKPAELDGEDVFQYRCEEEGRHRDTYHRNDRGEVVGKAVLLTGSGNTKGNCYKNFKDKRHESERKAVPDGVMEFLGDGDSPRPALAPFTSHSTLKPCKVTLNDAFIHAVLRIQIRKPLGVALACAGAGSQFSCLCLNIAHGHIVH